MPVFPARTAGASSITRKSSRRSARSPRPGISICAKALPPGSAIRVLPTPASGISGSRSKSSTSLPMPRRSARFSNARARPKAMPRPLLVGPRLVGIVNITADSFSDGGRFLNPAAAIAQARLLAAEGADIVELGAAASNVAASEVAPAEEIRRLDPVIAALAGTGTTLAIDTSQPETQRFGLARGVAYLNDIRGFPDPSVYPDLAAGDCRLVVMHAVEAEGRARQVDLAADEVWRRIEGFFAERVARLERAGIARERLILDPGMGFFLSSRADVSLRVLTTLDRLKRAFGLPIMVSVSRKSFLGAITGRSAPAERGAATLAAELYAAVHGADYIRTHDPAALRDALAVTEALAAEAANHPSAKSS